MVDIPQGGIIRNSIQWESYYSEGGTWYLHTIYESDSDVLASSSMAYINHPVKIYDVDIDIIIPTDAAIGIYDAWTVISTTNIVNNISPENIIAEKYDTGVLNVVLTNFAEIISTTFIEV